MRVPVVPGASVGQLAPFCGTNVAPGVMGMATGVGASLGVGCLVFPHFPLGRDVSGSPSAEIGDNVVISFMIVVSTFKVIGPTTQTPTLLFNLLNSNTLRMR